MAKQKFAIIHNLESLNKDQLAQYLRDASEYFKLDPDLNGLDTIWMNAEDGMRKLVVYARKGTADILRDIHGISVLGLVRDDSFPGCAVFAATGKNASGRQEMAHGAHSIEGLKGERLAYAIMTAQTRACRRLTLQFVGGGLLDVSEVNAQTTDIGSSQASLAQLAGAPAVIPPPQVVPNVAPGRVVMRTEEPAGYGISDPPKIAPPNDLSIVCLDCKRPLSVHPLVNSTRVCPSEQPVAQNPPNQGVSLQEIAAEPVVSSDQTTEPKRRTRKKRGQVDISSPGQPVSANAEKSASADIPESQRTVTPSPIPVPLAPLLAPLLLPSVPLAVTMTYQPMPAQSLEKQALIPEVVSKPVIPVINVEKQKEFQVRLSKYSSDILPKAGMMPSVGIGGSSFKLRKFAAQMDGVEDWRNRNEEQWEELFTFLDTYTAQNGAPALVQYIDKAIDAK